MGIRKHFEQKPSDEDLKLQDLSLEQDKFKEALFDVDWEVFNQEWDSIKEALENTSTSAGFLIFAANLKLLRPDRFNELDVSKRFSNVMESVDLYRSDENKWQEGLFVFLRVLAYMKLVFPDKEILTDDEYSFASNKLQYHRSEKNWQSFSDYALFLKILRPECEIAGLDEEARVGVRESVRSDIGMGTFVECLGTFRLLFTDEKRLNLKGNVEGDIERNFADLKGTRKWYRLAEYARNLKILEAEQVEVADGGIKLIMSKESFKAEKKPRPERKQF